MARGALVWAMLLLSCFMVAFALPRPPFELPVFRYTPLRFSQHAFKIALFADLHFGENAWESWGPAQDRKSTRIMSYFLDIENPDFVIFLGDILTANNILFQNATNYWNAALSATKERNIPWASVFGNHDDMHFEWPIEWFGPAGIPGIGEGTGAPCIDQYICGRTRADLMQNEMNNAFSLSRYGPRRLWPSLSNYAIEIASSAHSSKTSAILYFLDSGGGTYPQVISAAQAVWFEETSSELNPDERIPELAFWHVPSLAYKDVAPMCGGSPILEPCVGSINRESVDSQNAEFGIMDLISGRSSMKALFVGHNHGLDWCCPYKHMYLCFARHTGYGGYGSWMRGTRILDLVEDPFELKSYIRLENGTLTGLINLFPSSWYK